MQSLGPGTGVRRSGGDAACGVTSSCMEVTMKGQYEAITVSPRIHIHLTAVLVPLAVLGGVDMTCAAAAAAAALT